MNCFFQGTENGQFTTDEFAKKDIKGEALDVDVNPKSIESETSSAFKSIPSSPAITINASVANESSSSANNSLNSDASFSTTPDSTSSEKKSKTNRCFSCRKKVGLTGKAHFLLLKVKYYLPREIFPP